MGPAAPPLIIGNGSFRADDLTGQGGAWQVLAGAVVVGSKAELIDRLEQTKYPLVVHVTGPGPGWISSAEALQLVIDEGHGAPYLAVDETLSAVEVLSAGALDSAAVFDALGEGLAILDAELRIVAINPALQAMIGDNAASSEPDSLFDLDAGELGRKLETCRTHSGSWRGEVNLRRQDGSSFPASAVATPLPAAADRPAAPRGFVVLLSDRSEQQQREQEILRQASMDPLTRLPNRSLLLDRTSQALAVAKRNKNQVAVLYADLDHFKSANDTWGHAAGDAVLVEAARRMQACVRESDTVARMGGDEFAIILTDIGEDFYAEKLAAKIGGALERPFLLDGAAIYLSASIGIALYPQHGAEVTTLLECADAAMYEVKRNGRRGFRLYGDRAAISTPQPTVGARPHARVAAPFWFNARQNLFAFVSKKAVLPPISVFPAGLATACLVILLGWLVASGVISLNLQPPEELMTDTELNEFGTASGPGEDGKLPALNDLGASPD